MRENLKAARRAEGMTQETEAFLRFKKLLNSNIRNQRFTVHLEKIVRT